MYIIMDTYNMRRYHWLTQPPRLLLLVHSSFGRDIVILLVSQPGLSPVIWNMHIYNTMKYDIICRWSWLYIFTNWPAEYWLSCV